VRLAGVGAGPIHCGGGEALVRTTGATACAAHLPDSDWLGLVYVVRRPERLLSADLGTERHCSCLLVRE
jgi:hypothetical protein